MAERFWAIKGNHGFYTGTYLTRADAIAGHVNGRFRWHGSDKPEFITACGPEQIKDWRRCQRAGDKAVKVIITEDV